MPVAIAALAVALSCSGSGGDSNSSGGAGSTTGGSSSGGASATQAVGTFTVKLVPQSATGTPAQTQLAGAVREAATPALIVWRTNLTAGECTVVTPVAPFCDPGCDGATESCVESGVCVASQPKAHSVGEVTVTGVKTVAGGTLTMSPTTALTYAASVANLQYPPFAEGDAVRLAAAGGDYSAFTLDARGIPPLMMGASTTVLSPGEPISLIWEAPTLRDNARILVSIDISQHGGTRGKITCNTADTGALEISGELVTRLISLGVSGFPIIQVTRRAVGSAKIAPGRVDLQLDSMVELEVSVAGSQSCHTNDDCTTGTCQADLVCR